MKMIEASYEHFDIVKAIVRKTIETIYPKYYPQGAVDFFLHHHSDEAIKKAIVDKSVFLIQIDDTFVGTGSVNRNSINRLFVLPQYQVNGYGTAMMNELEKLIFKDYSKVILDASFPAFEMYVHRGYLPIEYHKIETENGHYLCYHVIKKCKL
jgi:GNAT superfamily N-acetyltransferase